MHLAFSLLINFRLVCNLELWWRLGTVNPLFNITLIFLISLHTLIKWYFCIECSPSKIGNTFTYSLLFLDIFATKKNMIIHYYLKCRSYHITLNHTSSCCCVYNQYCKFGERLFEVNEITIYISICNQVLTTISIYIIHSYLPS